jgi:dolichyl-phosphate beta-glucosyltransferase
MNPKFSIIIPAYNESYRIVKSINKIRKYFKNKGIKYEIVVVNDGSKDNTLRILNDLSKKYKQLRVLGGNINRGKGYAVKTGVLNSSGEYILFTDADLSTPIEELDNLFKYIKNGYDIVIGSRIIDPSKIKIKQPLYRRLPGNVFPILVNFIISRDIGDTQCGFKLFKRDVAKDIFKKQKISGFCFDVETLYLAKKGGYKVKEVAVTWTNFRDSKVNPLIDSIKMFIDLMKIRFMY